MRNETLLLISCFCLAACNGSGGNAANDATTDTDTQDLLNPMAIVIETPPIDGKLPVDLVPPV